MRVLWDGAVCLEEGERRLHLDPGRRRELSVVTHAHLDHVVEGAIMTPPTADVMKVRTGREDFSHAALPLGRRASAGGFDLTLHEAGHVLGSAMVEVGDILYTGDFSTGQGITCSGAVPRPCGTLVVEATYGDPRFVLPDRAAVLSDLLSWLEDGLESGPVVLGSYDFGKAQDLVALGNSIQAPVVVADRIAPICEVYRRHGLPLAYHSLSSAPDDVLSGPHLFITSRRELKRPLQGTVRDYRERGARTATVSGWCAFWDLSRSFDLDAQFPYSNHADFSAMMEFVRSCGPRKVYTVHGSCASLAKEISQRLKLPAEPLE